MKPKVLFLLAGCLLALAAWYVQRSDNAPNPFVPIVEGGERGDPRGGDIPEKYRDTVHKGVEYLVQNQHKDGHWEGDDGKHPVAVTALAGMALLMEGSTVNKGRYSANLRKAVDWLMDKSQPKRDGLIFSGHASETNRYMQGHGLATQFLAWSYRGESDVERRKKLEDVITRAGKYIAKSQSTQGGWYDTSKVEGHDFDSVSATAIQIQALYMLGNLGFPVRSETIATDAQEYLKTAIAKFEKGGKPMPNRSRSAETAAALACRSNANAYLDQDGLNTTWLNYCRTEVPVGDKIKFGRDEFTHYYFAQALFTVLLNPEINAGADGLAWSAYRKSVFDHLQTSQHKDGSWPAPQESQGGISVGHVYATAVWCTVMQFDKKQHPLTYSRARITF